MDEGMERRGESAKERVANAFPMADETRLPPAADALLALEDVYKSFGAMRVLDGITLRIKKGETVAVIGRSGTGKSVMLRLFVGLLAPDRGRVIFAGEDISSFDAQRLDAMRQRMSMLFQSGALFDSMSVADNVAFGLRVRGEGNEAVIAERVRHYLALVGLASAHKKMPSELSGGMRKRVALARAIATSPEIVFYDEPTTGLDPITAAAIADLIIRTREAMRGRDVTSVVVTHDMQVALKVADRIVMLHAGRIAAEGTPAYFRALQAGIPLHTYTPTDMLIAQFVRGEADGPLTAAGLA